MKGAGVREVTDTPAAAPGGHSMRIAFVTWDISGQATPIRLLATICEQAGHQPGIILGVPHLAKLRELADPALMEDMLPGLLERVAGAEVVALSFLSPHVPLARRVARAVAERYPDKVIVAGGVHASVRPAEALEFAHYVCVGEAEVTLPLFLDALAAGRPGDTVPGFFARGRLPARPGGGPVARDLGALPLPGLFFGRTHVFLPAERRWALRGPGRFLPGAGPGRVHHPYYMFPDRGCVGSCSYCCRPMIKRITGCHGIRKRPVEHCLAELEQVKAAMAEPFKICLYSDDLLMWKRRELDELMRGYVKRVGLPFMFLMSPLTYDPAKLDVIFSSGLVYFVEMGVQTGSERIKRLYRRRESRRQVLRAAHGLARRMRPRGLAPTFDLIMDSPWETRADRLATLRLASELPSPSRLLLFSLNVFPGTELYARALDEGLLDTESYQAQFDLGSYRDRRLRAASRELGLYRDLLRLAAATRAPFWLLRALYALGRAWLPPRLIQALLP